MKLKIKTAAVVLLFPVMWTACNDPVSYPDEPVIQFKSFESDADVAYLTISFTDGDGDIGLHEYETQAPYDYNLLIGYYEKAGGTWQPGLDDLGNHVRFDSRVSYMVPEGKNKALRGEIKVKISPYYNTMPPNPDTFKFDIQLIDRSLKRSNIAETPEMIR